MFRIYFPILFCVLMALGFRVYGFFLRKCRFSKARRHVRLSSNFADLVSRRVDTSGEGTVFGCFRASEVFLSLAAWTLWCLELGTGSDL